MDKKLAHKLFREELDKSDNELNEDITKSDERQISKLIRDELDKQMDKRDFEKKLTSILKKKLMDDKDVDNKMVEIASNVVTQLFKTLWVRRNVWRSRLKNKAN